MLSTIIKKITGEKKAIASFEIDNFLVIGKSKKIIKSEGIKVIIDGLSPKRIPVSTPIHTIFISTLSLAVFIIFNRHIINKLIIENTKLSETMDELKDCR